jgi:uncharacterized coiled-coil protein SlyX
MGNFPSYKIPELRARVGIKLPKLSVGLALQVQLMAKISADLALLDNIFEVFGSAATGKVRMFETENRWAMGIEAGALVNEDEIQMSAGADPSRLLPTGVMEPLKVKDLQSFSSIGGGEFQVLDAEAYNIGFTMDPIRPVGNVGSGDASRVDFSVPASIDVLQPVTVKVDGVTLNPSAYSVTDALHGVVTLNSPPAAGESVDIGFTVDTALNETLRQDIVAAQHNTLDKQIEQLELHQGHEDEAKSAALTAKSNLSLSLPDATRLAQIAARKAALEARSALIGPIGDKAKHFYDEMDRAINLRLNRLGGTGHAKKSIDSAKAATELQAERANEDHMAESEVGERELLTDEQQLLLAELASMSEDPDRPDRVPRHTNVLDSLETNLSAQKELLEKLSEQGPRLQDDERANAEVALGLVTASLDAVKARRRALIPYPQDYTAEATEPRQIFSRPNEQKLSNPFIVSISTPDITVVNATEGTIDLSTVVAARTPQKEAIESALDALYTELDSAESEEAKATAQAGIDEQRAAYRELSRVNVTYRYVAHTSTVEEPLTPADGAATTSNSPTTEILKPLDISVSDKEKGELKFPSRITSETDVLYRASMASTLFLRMTQAEKDARSAEIATRQSQVTNRLGEIDQVLRRRNIVN